MRSTAIWILLVGWIGLPGWGELPPAKLVLKGSTLLKQGDARQALELFNRAIVANPRYAPAFAERGELYAMSGEGAAAQGDDGASTFYEKAVGDFNRALQLNSKDGLTLVNRGLCYYRLARYRSALEDYDRALALRPNHAQTYAQRAMTYSKLGEDYRAAQDYTRAYQKGGDLRFLFNRANCYRRLEKNQLARADYQEVLKKTKDPRICSAAQARLKNLDAGAPEKPQTAPNRPRH